MPVSCLILACGRYARRMAAWQLGVAVAVGVGVVALWVVPVGITVLAVRALPYLHGHHGRRFDVLRGATIGALAGAIVTALMARWFETVWTGDESGHGARRGDRG